MGYPIGKGKPYYKNEMLESLEQGVGKPPKSIAGPLKSVALKKGLTTEEEQSAPELTAMEKAMQYLVSGKGVDADRPLLKKMAISGLGYKPEDITEDERRVQTQAASSWQQFQDAKAKEEEEQA